MSALMKMAEFSGLDPVQWRKDFHAKLMPQLENYLNMSDDERTALELSWERDHYKSQAESQSKRTEDEANFKAFETRVRGLQQTHQVSETEFETAFTELTRLQKEGKFKGDVTPEFVIETVRKERVWTAAESVLVGELKLNLTEPEKTSILRDLGNLALQNDLSIEDVQEIAREAWGKKKSQSISRKLQKSGEAEKIAPSKRAPVNPASEPWSFDDL
jgi:hypothetical protein